MRRFKTVFIFLSLLSSVSMAEDQPHYMVDVNVFVVRGNDEAPTQLTISANKWTKATVDGATCSFAAFSFGVVAQCQLGPVLEGSVAKCNPTIPDNSDTDDSLQLNPHTKLLLKCKTSHDEVPK